MYNTYENYLRLVYTKVLHKLHYDFFIKEQGLNLVLEEWFKLRLLSLPFLLLRRRRKLLPFVVVESQLHAAERQIC